jgi:hypothetical protein
MAANSLVATKQDLVASFVQKELKESASLLSCVQDYSNLAIKGSKQVSIPKYSSFTVGSRAFGAKGTESAALTDSVDDIALDKNKYVQFGYDSHDAMQSTTNYLVTAIERASSAHGREINTEIITEWEAVAELNLNAGVPADITASNILDMREQLISSFADMSRVKFVIAADQEKVLLGLPEFSRYDYRGGGASPIVNGTIGFVYGIPVILNQQIKAQQAFMIDPMGCGFAFQKAPMVAEDTDLDYGTGGKKVVVDALYGLGGLQLGEAGAAAGKSPLICKLIN